MTKKMKVKPLHVCESMVRRSQGQSTMRLVDYDFRGLIGDKDVREITPGKGYKGDFVRGGIYSPPGAQDFKSPHELWETMEALDIRWDSRPARRLNFALPNELSGDEAYDLAYTAMQDMYPGIPFSIAIHRSNHGGQENLHCHALVGWRQWDAANQCWGNKVHFKLSELSANMKYKRGALANRINAVLAEKTAKDNISRPQWLAVSYRNAFEAGIISYDRQPSKHYGPRATPEQRAKQEEIVAMQDRLGIQVDIAAWDLRFLDARIKCLQDRADREEREARAKAKAEAKKGKNRVQTPKKEKSPKPPKLADGSRMWDGMVFEAVQYIHPETLATITGPMMLTLDDGDWSLVDPTRSVVLRSDQWDDLVVDVQQYAQDDPDRDSDYVPAGASR